MQLIPLNFTDPGFDPAYTADFQLLLIINQDTFGYAVRHPATQRLVRVSTGNPLVGLFEQQGSPELTSSFQKIVVAVDTNSFCLVPDAVFTPENLLNFASLLLVKETDVILTDQIENGQNSVVFTFSGEVVRKLEDRFNTKKIEFAPKSWIKTVFKAQLPGQNLYLFLEGNRLQVLFPDQEKIRFYNQFSCSTTDELVYYTALVAKQLKLKPEETDLIVCGTIEAESIQLPHLKEFFNGVTLFGTEDFKEHNHLQQHQVVQFLGLS